MNLRRKEFKLKTNYILYVYMYQVKVLFREDDKLETTNVPTVWDKVFFTFVKFLFSLKCQSPRRSL